MFKKKQADKKSKILDLNSINDTDPTEALGKRSQVPSSDPNQEENQDSPQNAGRTPADRKLNPSSQLGATSELGTGPVSQVPEDPARLSRPRVDLSSQYSSLKAQIEREDDAELNKEDSRTLAQKMREQNQKSAKFFASVGPTRVFNTIKHTNTIDYNPSRCKDFHEAGYCVFGDSCIFAHDRSDYKFGWEQEIDWDKKQKRKTQRRKRRIEAAALGKEDEVSDSTDEEGLDAQDEPEKYGHVDPACLVCGGVYTSPTLVECGHVFCEGCAQHEYMKSGKCFKCGKKLSGIFNSGLRVLEKANAERKVRKEMKAMRKKRVGEAPSYLQDIHSIGNKWNGVVDTDEPVVVAEEDLKRALERIKRKEMQLDDLGEE